MVSISYFCPNSHITTYFEYNTLEILYNIQETNTWMDMSSSISVQNTLIPACVYLLHAGWLRLQIRKT